MSFKASYFGACGLLCCSSSFFCFEPLQKSATALDKPQTPSYNMGDPPRRLGQHFKRFSNIF